MGANCSKTKTRETIIAAPSWKPKNNVCLLSHTNVTCDAAKGGLVRFCYCAAAPAPAPRRAPPGDWKKGELGEWVEDVGMVEHVGTIVLAVFLGKLRHRKKKQEIEYGV